jgi:hypothetical protein
LKNTCLEAVLSELNAAGVRSISHANGGRHRQLRWAAPNGDPRVFNVSFGTSASDYRATANARSEVRRMLKADGLLVDRPPPAPRPLDRVSRLEQRIATLELEVAALRRGAFPKNSTGVGGGAS